MTEIMIPIKWLKGLRVQGTIENQTARTLTMNWKALCRKNGEYHGPKVLALSYCRVPQEDKVTLEAQLPIYWVPVLESLYKFILPITQGPTIWVPGLLG